MRGELIDTATAESDVTEEVWQAEYIREFGVPPPKEKLYDDETRAMSGWYAGEVDRQEQLQRAKESGLCAALSGSACLVYLRCLSARSGCASARECTEQPRLA